MRSTGRAAGAEGDTYIDLDDDGPPARELERRRDEGGGGGIAGEGAAPPGAGTDARMAAAGEAGLPARAAELFRAASGTGGAAATLMDDADAEVEPDVDANEIV